MVQLRTSTRRGRCAFCLSIRSCFFFSNLNISPDVGTIPSIRRYPVNRSGNNAGRVKRVVSCKRKSHHPLARRKQPGKTLTPSNNDGQQEIFASDPLEFPVNTSNRRRAGDPDLDQDGCSVLSEVRHVVTAVITLFLLCVLPF